MFNNSKSGLNITDTSILIIINIPYFISCSCIALFVTNLMLTDLSRPVLNYAKCKQRGLLNDHFDLFDQV